MYLPLSFEGEGEKEGEVETMYEDLFSKINKLRPTPEGLVHEEVPERARTGLYYLIEKYIGSSDKISYGFVYRELCVALRIPRERITDSLAFDFHYTPYIEGLINKCIWWHFYDICQALWILIKHNYPKHEAEKKALEFSNDVNTLFKEEQLGFELTKEGKIEKVGSGFIDAKVKEARYLLKEPEFKGADTQFEKAIKALNVRPNPDVENCVKDAVSAIESVGRIIVSDEKAILPDIIKDMTKRGIIPKPLDQTIQKIYAYRGDQPGVAHGLVGISEVTIDEAEFVLAMSAAMIIYLVKKRSKLETI